MREGVCVPNGHARAICVAIASSERLDNEMSVFDKK